MVSAIALPVLTYRRANYLSHVMRKPVLAICEQQRCRSVCTSAQSDQHICCLLFRQYNTWTCKIQNFKPLPSFRGCAGPFVSYLVANPNDRFFVRPGLFIIYNWNWTEGAKCLDTWQNSKCLQWIRAVEGQHSDNIARLNRALPIKLKCFSEQKIKEQKSLDCEI